MYKHKLSEKVVKWPVTTFVNFQILLQKFAIPITNNRNLKLPIG